MSDIRYLLVVTLVAMVVTTSVLASDEIPPLPPVPAANTPARARWCDGLHKAGLTLLGHAMLARSEGARLHRSEAEIKQMEDALTLEATSVMLAEKAEGCPRAPQ